MKISKEKIGDIIHWSVVGAVMLNVLICVIFSILNNGK